MYVSLKSEDGLWLVDNRLTEARAELLLRYIQHYLEPALKDFPELKGKIHLSLRSEGFFFGNAPDNQFRIVVKARHVNGLSKEQLRFVTGYMLCHFFLHIHGYEVILPVQKEKYYDRCAIFLSFAYGYAYDYLKSFEERCKKKKEFCDFREKFQSFRCCEVFPFPCEGLEDSKIRQLSEALKNAALQMDFSKVVDFDSVIRDAWNLVWSSESQAVRQ